MNGISKYHVRIETSNFARENINGFTSFENILRKCLDWSNMRLRPSTECGVLHRVSRMRVHSRCY